MTKQSVLWGWVAGFWVMVGLLGCAGTDRMPAGKSLYDRLGGKSSISAVVDQFVANVASDTRINGRFTTTDIRKLKSLLVDQVCMATGGPCLQWTRHEDNPCRHEDFKWGLRGISRGPRKIAGYVQGAVAGKGRTPGSPWTNEERYS